MKAFLAGYMAEFRDHIVRVLTVLPRTAKAPRHSDPPGMAAGCPMRRPRLTRGPV
jgi:hypothetical protein